MSDPNIEDQSLRSLMSDPNIEDRYRLTPLQEGMLFHTLRDTGVGMYVNQVAYTMQDLHVDSMRAAWQRLVERHSILRTSFTWENLEQPEQIVHRHVEVPFFTEDWRGLRGADQEMKLRQLLRNDRERGFDLLVAPLLRVFFSQLTDAAWNVVFTHHHLLLDGWSKHQINSDLRIFYNAAREGGPVSLPPARPFRDYIDYLATLDAGKAERFWRRYLDGLAGPTPLPAEIAATHRRDRRLRFGEWSVTVPEVAKERLLEVARRCRVTLNTILLGAWGILMSRYCGERDVLFGMLVSGRPPSLPGSESMVGMFLNALPVRIRVDEEEPFPIWVEKLQAELIEFREYEHTALRSIHDWSGIPAGTPIYECIVVNTNTLGTTSGGARQSQGMARRAMASSVQQNVPLHLDLETVGTDLLFKMTFDARRFEGASITRLMEHLASLLENITEDHSRRVTDLPLMTNRERQQSLIDWNRTEKPVPAFDGLHHLFEVQAGRVPDGVAVRFGGDVLTYADLNSRANRLAHYLRGRGVGRGSITGICVPRSLTMVTALLAVLKSGSAYVPLDPTYPRERLDFMLKDSGVKLVLTSSSLNRVFVGSAAEFVHLDQSTGAWDGESADDPEPCTGPEDLAYILYTSGSTGTPKGVAIPHRVSINRLHTEHDPIQPGEAFCSKTSLNFVDSLWELFSAWAHGACVTLIPDEALPDPALLVDALAASEATRLVLVPSLLRNLLESELSLAAKLPRLLHWISSGEPLPPDLCRKFSDLLPDRILTNLYGTSEVWDATRCDSRDRPAGEPLPIGRAMGNVRAYIVDPDLRPVPVGVPGELLVGGAGLALGYWNRPELTAEKFIPNPFAEGTGERLYRTGDEVRWSPDGQIEHLGRLDQQFKLRGFRIETGEVESVLRRHPALRNAAVAVTGSEQLAAYVVPAHGRNPDVADLRSFVREHLPEPMRPTIWKVLEELPLTPSGKIDRRALLKLETAGQPMGAENVAESATETETAIAEVWKGVLGIPKLGLHDNVFELGAHSLAATRAAVRIGKAIGMQIPLRAIFENPTVAALAAWFGKARNEVVVEEELPELQRAERGREVPLSFAQRRMWFLDQLDPGSVSYTVPNSIQFNGMLEPEKLEMALSEIVRRHESLRTTFLSREGEPFQVIHDPESVLIPLLDLTGLALEQRQEAARQRAREQSRQPWDLGNGPLFRAQLIRIAPLEHILVLTMHHIITDGRSTGVMAHELAVLYRAFTHNKPSPLPAPPLQYADFAIWQRDWLKGELLEKQLAYWRGQLAGLSDLELPTDFRRPRVHRYRGGRISFKLSRETTARLDAAGRSVGATPFMTLLAVFDVFLAMSSGQKDISVGTPVANRNRPELENVFGFFVNTIVMRTQLEGDPTFREALERTRQMCLGALDHQDVPFDKIVDELSPTRDLSRHPLFQVMFVHLEGAQGVRLPGISFRQGAAEMETSNFDLLLVTSESDEGYTGILQYNCDLFREATAARLGERLQLLFERLSADPDLPLSSISPFSAGELDEIEAWSRGGSLEIRGRLLQDWVTRQSQADPGRVAVESGTGTLTYGELDRLSDCLARRLCEAGLGPDRIAGLCVEKSPDMLVGLFGILKAGGAVLAIDPEYPDERISLMFSDAAVNILVTHDIYRERIESMLPEIRTVVLMDRRDEWAERESGPALPTVRPGNLAYVIFTSGSTGKPKGVLVEHRNAVSIIEAQLDPFGIDASSKVLQMLSLSFDAALGEIFRAIAAGATLYVAPKDQLVPGPGLVDLMRDCAITVLALPPTVLAALPQEAAEQLPALRTLTVGGEACSPQLARHWGRGRRMINGYGPTETTIGATVAVNWNLDEKPPLGRPLANVATCVLDEAMRPVPVGVPGELFIGGAGVTRGYLNRPGLTAQVFLPDPFSGVPGSRLYRTGDLVRWLPDGRLDFLGRKDQQVKIRGFRIEPGEIAAVVQTHKDVAQCVVVVREDRGIQRLVGYVTSRKRRMNSSNSELRAFVKEHLPNYMVPVAFVVLPTIPMTVNGKVDYKALPQPDLNIVSESDYVAPRNEVEEQLEAIWKKVLGLEKVGIHANFFELGGDSILSIQVIARGTEIGIALSVRDVFEHQTIAKLAEVVRTDVQSTAEQEPVTGEVPLTPIQVWYLGQNSGEPSYFNHSMTLPAPPAVFRTGVLETALEALFAHHDALRARFRRDAQGVWRQTFLPPGDAPKVERHDLGELSGEERKSAIDARTLAAHESLDIAEGPICRVLLFDMGGGPGRMVVVVHHLVTDIVSWQILVQDLLGAIQKAANGVRPRFPPKTDSYKRWATLLRSHAETPQLLGELDYWSDARRRTVGRLPVDHPNGGNTRASSTIYTDTLSEEESRLLLEGLPRRSGASVRDILVAALAQTLCLWSNSSRIVIDLEGHGREEVGEEVLNLSRTIGWFTSFYPALLEMPGNGEDLAASISTQLAAVPNHGIGYGILRFLNSDPAVRDRFGELPSSEVAFNYTGHGGHGQSRGTDTASLENIGQIALSQSDRRKRLHLFEIVAGFVNGSLLIRWGCSTDMYTGETVAHVSKRFLDNLRQLCTEHAEDRLTISSSP